MELPRTLRKRPQIFLVGLLAAGCAKKTADLEIEAAATAMDRARTRFADECAKETFRAAETALAEAQYLAIDGAIEEARKTANQARALADQAAAASKPGCRDSLARELPPGDGADHSRLAGSTLRVEDALRTVYFDYNDATIREESKAFLSQVAEALVAQRSVSIEIEGHCDVRGSTEYNLHLGERRARSVQKYLLTQGVAPEQVSIISYGEERPVDAGQTERAHQLNRRAELTKN